MLLKGKKITFNPSVYHYSNNTPSKNVDKNDDYYKLIDSALDKINKQKYKVDIDGISEELLNFIINRYDIIDTRFLCIVSRTGSVDLLKRVLNALDNNIKKYKHHHLLLHYAIFSGNFKAIEFLINAGAEVNLPEKRKQSTPLHTAAKYSSPVTITFLLKQGARIDNIDIDGNTPLHIACKYGNFRVIEQLAFNQIVSHSMNYSYYANMIKIKNKNNKTPVDIATERGESEILKIFQKFQDH
ncbi:MAG: hypothetical protein GY750_06565 [Lentisphaerae bacterium]|nr:hypothetical protein [Lentisphaerota bacterium]